MRPNLKRIAFGAFGLSLALLMGATVYYQFSPGGALSGSWNSQNVNVAAGSPFITGNLPVTNGGTGVATLTAHGVLLGEGTGNVAAVSALAADTLLQGQGATSDPAAVSVSNCGDASHALSYSTSTHAFGCQAITTGNAVTVALKTSDTSRATTTVQAADPDLAFGTVAAGFYRFTGVLQIGSSTSGIADGLITGTNANVTAQSNYQQICTDGAATAITFSGNTTFIQGVGGTIGSLNLAQETTCQLTGSIRITGAGSTVVFTWAQKTSSSTATVVQGGSYLKLEKIG